MRFMLHCLMLRTVDGQAISLTSHLFRHSFATELRALNTPIDVIALLMKQRDIKVTDYYSQPTPASLVELQKRIFENRVDLSRAHIRSSAAIKCQIREAKDAVGTMIPILGGTCTIATQMIGKV